jgi:hypothetical protein
VPPDGHARRHRMRIRRAAHTGLAHRGYDRAGAAR